MSVKDADALQQRMHVALLTKKYIYYKPPRSVDPVRRMSWPHGLNGMPRYDLFTEVGENIMKKHANDEHNNS